MSERCATCGEPHPPCPAAGCICHPTHPLNTPAPLADGWVQSTHWEGCWNYGRKHYDCALAEIAALRARVAELERVIEEAFVRGASWAYGELTGAIIVPASFEQKAVEEAKVNG